MESSFTPKQKINDSQEWVLFSPTHVQTTGPRTQTASTAKLSDFGSLNTIAKSIRTDDGRTSEAIDDDEELDSLDDGLPAFREPSIHNTSRRLDHIGGSILPAHDGLGTFAASSHPVQEQIWNFEQYNPRKVITGHRRRRSSVQRRLDTIEDVEGTLLEDTRWERIEKWRAEQSKVLLEEIEKETRRRALDQTSGSTRNHDSAEKVEGKENQLKASSLTCEALLAEETKPVESESLWQRIRRRVIRDLIGIDDTILSVIFGESLAPEDLLSTTPTQLSHLATRPTTSEEPTSATGWEKRLLDRLARELGILVYQLSNHPPGAFSTYLTPKTMDYAGIPITTPLSEPLPKTPLHQALPSQPHSPRTTESSQSPYFNPTLNHQDHQTKASASEHAARWGIEDTDHPSAPLAETDYWERTPDLKTVFSYLQHRFSSQHSSSSRPNIATANTPDSLRRAAIIRQHHPLVSRSAKAIDRHNARRGSFLLHTHQYGMMGTGSQSLKRAGTSCASWSTKKSRRDTSERSRNYWDLGGSVGSGSVVGGVGVWGEV